MFVKDTLIKMGRKKDSQEDLAEFLLLHIYDDEFVEVEKIAKRLFDDNKISEEQYETLDDYAELINTYLQDMKYLRYYAEESNYVLTELGIEVKNNGGTEKYKQSKIESVQKAQQNERKYNILKDIIIPILVALLTLFSVVQGCTNNDLEKRMKQLETKMDSIK